MKRRPWIVTCLSLAVLTFAIVQFMGLAAWYRLPDIDLSIPGWYLPGKSILWGVIAAVGAVGLFAGLRWSTWLVRAAGMLHLLWFWIDRLCVRGSSFARTTLPFYGTLVTLVTLLMLWILQWKRVRAYVEEPCE